MNMKKCKICNIIKEENNYYKNIRTKDGLTNKCITCISKENKIKYRKQNPLKKVSKTKKCNCCKIVKNKKEFYKKTKYYSSYCKECSKLNYRKFQVKRDYNIDYFDYLKMIDNQNNKCAICKKPNDRSLCIDHCHETNKVRGLLCDNCNIGLGKFKDNKLLLKQAIFYLEKY